MSLDFSIKRDDIGIAIRNKLIADGYSYINPPIIQDAEHFIELSGENIRRRLFIVNDNEDNAELCLRPEFTIPIIKEYIESSEINSAENQKYCYYGNVFRLKKAKDGVRVRSEIGQAGIEMFSPKNDENIEAECLDAILGIFEANNLNKLNISLGDYSIFNEFINKLDISNFWKSRFKRRFFHKREFTTEHDFTSNYGKDVDELIRSIYGIDKDEAVILLEKLLAKNNIPSFGSRTIKDIAMRLISKADSIYGKHPSAELLEELTKYHKISGKLDDVLYELSKLSEKLSINIDKKLDETEKRYSKIISNFKSSYDYKFTSFFDSKFEYYSGFIFNIEAIKNEHTYQIAQGGRYDRLLKKLEIKEDIAAVGGSIYIDNLIDALSLPASFEKNKIKEGEL